jgi:hypothetical protein
LFSSTRDLDSLNLSVEKIFLSITVVEFSISLIYAIYQETVYVIKYSKSRSASLCGQFILGFYALGVEPQIFLEMLVGMRVRGRGRGGGREGRRRGGEGEKKVLVLIYFYVARKHSTWETTDQK